MHDKFEEIELNCFDANVQIRKTVTITNNNCNNYTTNTIIGHNESSIGSAVHYKK